MIELTAKEKAVMEYIGEAIRTYGYPPSVRDIQMAVGFRSTSTVHSYLARLEEKGYIRREQGKSRSLRLEGNDDLSNQSNIIKLPMLGRVAAGSPILAIENLEGYLDFPASSLGRLPAGAELFALRVAGESMIGDGIMDGDLVVIRKDNRAEDGDMVVALVNDEATVKRLYREDGRYRLQPSNPTMEPIYVDEVYVLGHVVAVMRYYNG